MAKAKAFINFYYTSSAKVVLEEYRIQSLNLEHNIQWIEKHFWIETHLNTKAF